MKTEYHGTQASGPATLAGCLRPLIDTTPVVQIHSVHHRAVYGLFRRAGLQHHDAEDLTQDFWHKILRLGCAAQSDENSTPADSHFNGYARRFLMNWFRNETRRQRRLPVNSFTDLTGDDPDDDPIEFPDRLGLPPDATIEQRRLIMLVSAVLVHQRNHHAASGHEALFDTLCDSLTGTGRIDWETMAIPEVNYRFSPGALRTTVHRMRLALKKALARQLEIAIAS